MYGQCLRNRVNNFGGTFPAPAYLCPPENYPSTSGLHDHVRTVYLKGVSATSTKGNWTKFMSKSAGVFKKQKVDRLLVSGSMFRLFWRKEVEFLAENSLHHSKRVELTALQRQLPPRRVLQAIIVISQENYVYI